MKLFGLKSLYCICMRRNSRPVKTSIKFRSKSFTKFSICEPTRLPSGYWSPSGFELLLALPLVWAPPALPLFPASLCSWPLPSRLLCTTTNWGAGIWMPPTWTLWRPEGPAIELLSARGWLPGTPMLITETVLPLFVLKVVERARRPFIVLEKRWF